MAYVLMMTADDSFHDQWCEGVFDTQGKAYDKMIELYDSRRADAEEDDYCHIDQWTACVEDVFGNGNQWAIIAA